MTTTTPHPPDERQPQLPALPLGTILRGDAAEQLRRLPASSVDCIVTSPPYFLLRNYFQPDQIGHEASIEAWVQALLPVFSQAKRVLKETGALWLNLGDTYSRKEAHGAPAKSLLLGPERLLLALSRDGWIVRSKVVWAKPNPTPTPVKDRLACTWEPFFLLTKTAHYYFDLDTIRVPGRPPKTPTKDTQQSSQIEPQVKASGSSSTRPDWAGPLAGSNLGLAAMRAAGLSTHPLGKNPGDIWSYATSNFRGGHFATFPEGLLTRPILTTCPGRICTTCGLPWRRAPFIRIAGEPTQRGRLRKSCPCPSRAHRPGVVLDPFIGSGTTALAAVKAGRSWLGIELNPEFIQIAKERLAAKGLELRPAPPEPRHETKSKTEAPTTAAA